LPRAVGHTLLTKQRTNPPLHIHKRRFTYLQRLLNDVPAIHEPPNHGGPLIQSWRKKQL